MNGIEGYSAARFFNDSQINSRLLLLTSIQGPQIPAKIMKISYIVTLLCSAATAASATAIQKRQMTPAAPVDQYKAPTYVRPKHPSKRVQTAFDVLDGFKEWTVEGVTRWNGPGFQHQVLPRTLSPFPSHTALN